MKIKNNSTNVEYWLEVIEVNVWKTERQVFIKLQLVLFMLQLGMLPYHWRPVRIEYLY